tara:strand:+ start:1337 stop:1504 length:168 start_codon:yes stop_codon:yes gene_type:complete
MLSNILDEKSQAKISELFNKIIFPVKCYAIILLIILLLNSYYLYKISENLTDLKK